MKHFLLLTTFILCTGILFSQIRVDGTPPSFVRTLQEQAPIITMPTVEIASLQVEDAINDANGKPYRFAKPIKVDYDLNNSGQWEILPNGSRLWRLSIHSPNALSLNIIFKTFDLPEGAQLYIYNEDRSQVIGAFTNINNNIHQSLATEIINDDFVTIEYFEPKKVQGLGQLALGQVAHGYRGFNDLLRIDESGSCQVNINCDEGVNWQDEKKGIARIVVNGINICSGTLVNNTRRDCAPYFLTANHCVSSYYDAITNPNATVVFYWNYERAGCANTGTAPLNQTSSGATLVANNSYSDFALLLLNNNPKNSYDVYFNGWDHSGGTGSGGVGIHHPSGDIKKIATHSITPSSSGNYWGIFWDATMNGHSVMEAGSSGSPLFRNNAHVIGQLFGGSSVNCADPANDLASYGKFSSSWTSNNNGDIRRRLNAWLDPANSGLQMLDGAQNPCDIPEIDFLVSSSSFVEGNNETEDGCKDYQLVDVTVTINATPTLPASVTLIDTGTGSAKAGFDYEIVSTNFVNFFGTIYTNDFTIKIFDDEEVEGIETIEFAYSLNANGGNAIPGFINPTHTLFIVDDDNIPTPTGSGTILDVDFESGWGGFTSTNPNATPVFNIGTESDLVSALWSTTGNTSSFAFVNDNACNCNLDNVQLISPSMDFSAYNNITLTFDHAFSDLGVESSFVFVSVDGGTNWIPVASNSNTSNSQGAGAFQTPWVNTVSVDLSAYASFNNVMISFQYRDGNSWAYGLGIDNVKIVGSSSLTIQDQVNSSNKDNQHLGPFQTVYFYDPLTGRIMLSIENLSSHDFGCAEVEVDRAGSGGLSWLSGYDIALKSFKVNVEHNNTNADYRISLYYKNTELPTWGLYSLVKTENSISTSTIANTIIASSTIQSTFGSDLVFTSDFKGFSGFGISNAPTNALLPIELISFKGKHIKGEGNDLTWRSETEINSDYFDIERSIDGINFEKIGQTKAAGNSEIILDYQFMDLYYFEKTNYYRLKMVDLDGSFEYSQTIVISLESKGDVNLYPNPFSDQLKITFPYQYMKADVKLINALGKVVMIKKDLVIQGDKIELDLNHLSVGTYFIEIQVDADTHHFKIIKSN